MHMGTLVALLWYFRAEVLRYGTAFFRSLGTRALTASGPPKGGDPDSRIAWCLVVGTLPAALAGLLFGDQVGSTLRSASVVATTTIAYALLLGAADVFGAKQRDET